MNLLEVREITKNYGDKTVVDQISFEAQAGQILGLLGPNGAGKTTAIRMIMDITVPDSGEIWFTADGNRTAGVPRHAIGYLPEERGLYRDAKIVPLLVFLAGLKGVEPETARRRALEWLERFELQNYANAKVEQLSKGMAQKVQFIAAVLHEPKFIVLDEPFSGLDPVNQELIKTEIRNLAARGAVVLLSSHQMNIVEELCDQIFLIHRGQKVVSGTLRQIKESYGNFRVYIETEAGIEQFTKLPGVADVNRLSESRWMLNLQDGTAPAKFMKAVPDSVQIDELQIMRPSLHDIFVKVATGGENQ
ncbi:MAG: ATP-binding cassette domain-containing protein [Firmicutes bacterium]|jgi:ABC-2 type transport system ATP-binding protein|nr:ATP-binding cassette domain-containing protein [Bacillota bacterium]